MENHGKSWKIMENTEETPRKHRGNTEGTHGVKHGGKHEKTVKTLGVFMPFSSKRQIINFSSKHQKVTLFTLRSIKETPNHRFGKNRFQCQRRASVNR